MSVTVPTSFSGPALQEYTEGRIISVADLTDIVQANNYQWSVAGVHADGIVFDPVFTTTSATYTKTNSTSGGRDLDNWWPTYRSERQAESSGSKASIIEVTAMLAGASLGVEVFYGESSIGVITVTQTSLVMTKTTATAVVLTGGVAFPLTLVPLGIKTAGAATTARCAICGARDYRLTATNMPRGR